ncbi:hypothetical protein EYF80_034580 [Liparis tanakae]|uniref:Uncharacterized protein n=1 Tax=Liparis tanakae TaxID=230148 RepID=A0A4Z2GNU6_9TELE|nr:hypothetical protein EYF80_034580 [Liparis tanakae]
MKSSNRGAGGQVLTSHAAAPNAGTSGGGREGGEGGGGVTSTWLGRTSARRAVEDVKTTGEEPGGRSHWERREETLQRGDVTRVIR